ncbi:alanine racemase [Actinorhabdospora filicis]|uniref:Alanine racemase n=1 Tax=Actinorhabdospora filicis TaxID=1785913 RepID=A0A9W6SHW0_9ACTN|nr:alanine racemase [Actinorhabdospora filicis]GLZ76578.1 alanine racemase [Actinorhabdospora filicis]
MLDQTEALIDLDAIGANTALLASMTSAEVMAVVKADGYGHGLVPSARAALGGGATWLGVATLDEARRLREAGVTAPTLAWLHTSGQDFAGAIAADVDLSASTLGQVAELSAAAQHAGRPARVHLKIDTGLSRNGARPEEWPMLLDAAAKAQADGHAEVVGVWSHLACADVPDAQANADQLAVFVAAVEAAENAGLEVPHRHLANTPGLLAAPETHFTLVRPGIGVYGLSPMPGETYGLIPAMTLRARVALVKRVPAGTGVSYGHTYTTDRETTLALVPLGYGDGVPRAASSIGPVAINGERFTIAGRVCMDQFVVDVGDHDVAEGDTAVLFGPDGPSADDWATATGTINYEIVTRVSPRVPRRYIGGAL